MLRKEDDPRSWIEKAESDARAVEVLLSAQPPAIDAGCFHIQQAIEKALKAVLVDRRVAFPYVHDIGQLLDLLAPVDELETIEAILSGTTYFATGMRYPGAPIPSESEVQRAWNAMIRCLDWAKREVAF